jgi:hypothetical protein
MNEDTVEIGGISCSVGKRRDGTTILTVEGGVDKLVFEQELSLPLHKLHWTSIGSDRSYLHLVLVEETDRASSSVLEIAQLSPALIP